MFVCVRSSRPKRTDEGGSRLLHKAILGLRPKRGENTSTFSRGGVSKREKVILIPASMLGDCAPENIVLTNKIVQDTGNLCNLLLDCMGFRKAWQYLVVVFLGGGGGGFLPHPIMGFNLQ